MQSGSRIVSEDVAGLPIWAINQLERTGGQMEAMKLGVGDCLDTGEEQEDRAGGEDLISPEGFGSV